jgi:hypothetical protein
MSYRLLITKETEKAAEFKRAIERKRGLSLHVNESFLNGDLQINVL